MFGFNYESFKAALKKAQDDSYAILMKDIEIVKTHVEKCLTMFLESNANLSRMNYPGIEA